MTKKRKFTMSLGKRYLSVLGTFILGFFIVFISPLFTGSSYSYEEAVLNEYQMVGNNIQIALVKKEYNPEKKIMRLDFSIEETNSNSLLSNIKYEISSQYIKDKEPLNVKSIRVNDNYFVAIIKDLPEDFSVLSTTIIPKYIHPEIEKNNDLQDKSIKMYVNQSDEIVNTNLKIENKKDYEKEYIVFQQQTLRKQIKSNKKEIKIQKLAISELNKLINELQNDLNYQTEEEMIQTVTEINTHQTDIEQHQKEVETLEDENTQLEEKIQLLKSKMNSV